MSARTFLATLLALLAAKRLLRRRGLAGAIQTVNQSPVSIARPKMADAECRVVDSHVALVAAWLPIRALCIEQSLALCVLLRSAGYDARTVVGVSTLPFYAHAWVQIGGTPINADEELTRQLAPLVEGAA